MRGLGLTTEALATYQEIICNDTTNTRAFIEGGRKFCRALAKYNQALKYYEHTPDLNRKTNMYVFNISATSLPTEV